MTWSAPIERSSSNFPVLSTAVTSAPTLANRAARTQGEAPSAATGVGRLSFGLFATLDELFKPTAMHTKQSVH